MNPRPKVNKVVLAYSGGLDTSVIVPWLRIVTGGIMMLVGAGTFVFLSGLGVIVADPIAFGVLSLVGLIGGGFLFLVSVPGMVAGVGLLRRLAWARILALVVAFLDLVNFPIGTAISLYSFFVLLQDAAPAYFNGIRCCADAPPAVDRRPLAAGR